MVNRKYITHNENGGFPLIETLIAVGICVVLLTVFFTSAINFFTVYDRPDIDLNAKGSGVMEMLLNSPGQGLNNNKNWDEGGPEDVEVLGLGTSQTVEYGILQITDEGEIIIHSRHSFSNNIGVVETCFLAGTKVLMADDLYKNIEEIDVGDFVKSYDEETDKLVAGRVTQIFHYSPEEMISDYYIVINDQLCVTPSHRFYSNGEWVYARDLKIGDMLFHSLSDNTIYSVEKIFEKRPVYDLEVAVYHTYFVAMDTTDVLVHNQDPPTAEFTWFDCDGPLRPGTNITFDASSSEFPESGGSDPGDSWYSWWWDWVEGSSDPNNPDLSTKDDPIVYNDSKNNIPHVVRLLVNDTTGNDSCIYTVQANNFDPPDTTPGSETDLAVYPETGNETVMSYDENHYVKYTDLGNDYYLYEIKEKTNSPYTILDYQKIIGLTGVNYPTAKSALGFSTQKYYAYNFNIAVSADSGAILPSYGASYAHPTITASYCISRDVVIYHPPGDLNGDNVIDELPYYENGRITVRMFIGGITPNYPPYEPRSPDPDNGERLVPWNKEHLSWLGDDPNGDYVTYDVYFSTTNPPPMVKNNQSGTTYDPGLMEPNTTYYWQIVAWEPLGNSTAGPVWNFTTHHNRPPYTPRNPNPSNGTANVDTNTILSWNGGDPDEDMGDTVTYDVYFGTEGTGGPGGSGDVVYLELISYNQSSASCNPSALLGILRLEYNKTYYWKIVARDSHSELTAGPIWNFITAEKGLDQYNTEGSGEGLSTGSYLGQTFTAGRTGNLTNIKLSLKLVYESGEPPDEDITVVIYECEDPQDPEGIGEPIADTIIPSFNDDEFIWKNAIFNNPAHVTEGEHYFIVINSTEKRTYNWQYSYSSVSVPGEPGSSGYPHGMPYVSHDGGDWSRAVEIEEEDDFLFKTYVFREPELDQYCCLDHSDAEVPTDSDLAQSFIAGRSGDLMKVNLSLASVTPGSQGITVEIYEELREEAPLLANTTIEDFDSHYSFVWKEANFSNPACLKEGIPYFIVVKTVDPYLWEMSIDDNCYSDGTAWRDSDGHGHWEKLLIDLIFETYMDDID